MGLSDIDEDEPPVVQRPSAPPASTPIVLQPVAQAAPAPPTSNTAKKGFDLDDLFGGMGVSGGATGSGAPAPAPVPVATAATAESASVPSNDVLDSLFATASPLAPSGVASASPTGSTNSFGVQSKPSGGSMLYVGDEDAGAADDGTNLFDTSKPVEKQTFSTAESLLEAFARQGKKGGPSRFDAKDSLDHLTKNKDDNKVRARLLALMDYYDVLGVAHTASEEEIKRSYRRKALELHPDRVGRDQTPEEAELFKTITKANEVLTDPEKRAEYDRQLRSGGGGFAPAGAAGAGADWFSHLQPPQ